MRRVWIWCIGSMSLLQLSPAQESMTRMVAGLAMLQLRLTGRQPCFTLVCGKAKLCRGPWQ